MDTVSHSARESGLGLGLDDDNYHDLETHGGEDTESVASYDTVGTEHTMVHLALDCEEGSALAELWRVGALCDVTLRADGMDVRAHRIVLAAASPFFRAMFTTTGEKMLEGKSDVVEIKGVDQASMKACIEAVYVKKVNVSLVNLQSLLAASTHLGISAVRRACCEFLSERLCAQTSTCLYALSLASTYACEDELSKALSHAVSNFPDILEQDSGKWFTALPLDLVLMLLQSDSLKVENELQAFLAGVRWVEADQDSRASSMESILRAIRLTLIPPPALRSQVLRCQAVLSQPACLQYVADTLGHSPHSGLPASEGTVEGKVAGAWGCLVPGPGGILRERPRRMSIAGRLVVVGGHDDLWRSLKCCEVYEPQRSSGWISVPPMDQAMSFVGSAGIDGRLFVVGGSTFNTTVARLTWQEAAPRWSPGPPLRASRLHSGIAAAEGVLYACGGRSGAQEMRGVEMYRPGSHEWCEVAAMTCARSSLSAATVGKNVFVVGGQAGPTTFNGCEMYDPQADSWYALSCMMQRRRKYLGVAVLDNRIFAVGGVNEQRIRLNCMEYMDPREGVWRLVAGMSVPRSSHGVAALDGRLYVAGGAAGEENTCHDSVECYCPYTNTWTKAPSMSMPRSGLTLAAM